LVSEGSVVKGNLLRSVVGLQTFIDDDAEVVESVIGPRSYVGKGAKLYRVITGESVCIEEGVVIGEGEDLPNEVAPQIYTDGITVIGRNASIVKGSHLGRQVAVIFNLGDIHHIFPKDYLRKNGMKRSQYNQIANYVYMQSEINIKIGNKAPKEYFADLIQQCSGGGLKYGGINSLEELKENLGMNCIPESIFTMTFENYEEFLEQRRLLMAKKIRDYYYTL